MSGDGKCVHGNALHIACVACDRARTAEGLPEGARLLDVSNSDGVPRATYRLLGNVERVEIKFSFEI